MDKEAYIKGFEEELEKIGLKGSTIASALMKRHFQQHGKILPITGFLKQLIGIKAVHPAKMFNPLGRMFTTGPFHTRARQWFEIGKMFK